MVFFNYALRKLNAKIVYYGPGLCGKTTNLQWIHDHYEGGEKGKMVSLATEGDRTIFFDLLPIEIGTIRGMEVTLQLYTVPGQVHYNSTRQLVLRGADGVVFVGDSQRTMRGSNQESLVNLEENLKLQGINLEGFPHVLQFNKRDLGDLMSVEEMDSHLNQFDVPFFEAVAVEGIGVQETLQGIVRLVMRSLRDRYEAHGAAPKQPSATPRASGSWPVNLPSPAGMQRPPGAPSVPIAASRPSPAAPPEVDEGSLETRPPTGGPWSWSSRQDDKAVQPDDPTDVYKSPGQDPETPTSFGFVEHKDEMWQVDEPTDPKSEQPPVEAPRPVAPVMPKPPVSEPPAVDDAEAFEVEDAEADEIDTHTDILIPPPEDASEAEATDEPELLEPEHVIAEEPASTQHIAEATVDDAAPPKPVPEPPAEPAGPQAESLADVESYDAFEPAAPQPPDATPAPPRAPALTPPRPASPPPQQPTGEAPAAGVGEGAARPEEQEWEDDPRTVEIDPTSLPQGPPLGATAPLRKPNADELVASVLGQGRKAVVRPESEPTPPVAETPRDRPAHHEPPESTAAGASVPEAPFAESPAEPFSPPPAEPEPVPAPKARASQVVFLSDDEPFGEPVPELGEPSVSARLVEGELESSESPIEVSAEDNSLALKLSGKGALVESGQVRALDIEVPVPGKWVGNRRVTLQLRLTLAPAEDEDDR